MLVQVAMSSNKLIIRLIVTFGLIGSSLTGCPFHNNLRQVRQKRATKETCGVIVDSCKDVTSRSIDGSCNNLKNPSWGTPYSPYRRLLPANFGDGIKEPPVALSGNPLPNAREVSLQLYTDANVLEQDFTLSAMQYGQFLAHDMSFAQSEGNSAENCLPIYRPTNDPVSKVSDSTCMEFDRTVTTLDRNCTSPDTPATALNSVTSYVDLSIVYGSDLETSNSLREMKNGRFKVEQINGQDFPLKGQSASYKLGDVRGNQSPHLAIIQIIWVLEHNRVADALAKLNPEWDDETLFQEARKIVIAEHQQISYYELLPTYLGQQNLLDKKIIYESQDFIDDYQDDVDPNVSVEQGSAAFRFFHSQIAGILQLWAENHTVAKEVWISDHWNNPAILEEGQSFADLVRGFVTQREMGSDRFHDQEVTMFLFKKPGDFGNDLKAIDIQRSRDHGIPSYNFYRKLAGLTVAKDFEDLSNEMDGGAIQILKVLYETVDDIDLTVGGSAEVRVKDTISGPTFLNILLEQFWTARVADRFWFERNQEGGLSSKQLQEIRKASFSRILCDNGNNVNEIQANSFRLISPDNSVKSCNELPEVDLSQWKA